MGKLSAYPVRIAPPNPFVMRLVSAALLLYASGALLLWMSLSESASYLNPKLQAKLLLVGLLSANALVLQWVSFPHLVRRGRRLTPLNLHDACGVAAPVALSNCLWMYCAFLGIARPWNQGVTMSKVLLVGALLFALSFASVLVVLTPSRARPRGKPDWVDSLKGRLGALGAALGT